MSWRVDFIRFDLQTVKLGKRKSIKAFGLELLFDR